jgi:F-type H+-transporting ATPase subunit b
MPGQPGQRPGMGQPMPGQQPGMPGQPGQRPGMPGQRPGMPGRPAQLPPGHPPVPGLPAPAAAAPVAHEKVCPGHGPTDKPHAPNLWQGIIGVNNDKAGSPQASVLDKLLWRYENHDDPCDEKNKPPPLLANIINFAILAFLVVRFGRKPIAEALIKRKQSIMGEIDNATRLKNEAAARLKDYKKKFARIDHTLAELKAEYVAQAEVEKRRILAEAEERRVRMRRDAEFRIEQERKAARVDLTKQAVTEAVAAAERLLETRVAAGDHDRAAEEYLTGIAAALRGSAGPRGASTGTRPPGGASMAPASGGRS